MAFVLGLGFTLLYDVVKEAMGGELLSYKPLNDLKSTLDSLDSQTVQQIGDLNEKLGLSLSEVEGLQRQMGKATELVPKLSSKLQTSNCILRCQYSNQLVKLDRSLKALLGKLTIQGLKVQRETLFEFKQMASNVAAEQATIEQKLTVQSDLGKKHSETLAGIEDILRILDEKFDSFRNLLKKMEGPEEGGAEISPNAKQDAQELLKLQGIIRRQLNTQLVDQEASQVMDHTLVPISNIVDLEVQQEPTEVAETLLPTSNITDQVVQQEPTEIAETLPTSNITDQEVQQESTEVVEVAETLPTSNITDQEVQQESTEVAETLLPTSNTETELEGVQENALVPGAAVGVVFNVLYEVVKDVMDKTMMFRELIGDLDSTLEALIPLIKEVERYNGVLGRSNKEVEKIMRQLEDGRKLILKFSKIRWWNSFKRYKYAKQLLDLDKCLNRWLTILTVEGIRNGFEKLGISKEALAAVQKNGFVGIGNKENVLIQKQEGFHDMGSLPEPPRVTVGLDGPLRDLKMMLFEDDVSMLVLTAAGGCGKTTLAMKICQDEDVKAKFKNNIFFVTVSKEPNLDVLQELYQRMNSQEGQDPLLLVLDDVWFKSKSLLQKFDEIKLPNYKILVTSRSEFPGFGTPYNLKALNDEDSMTLLRHSASLGNSLSVPEDLLKKILKHCKGVPLAITVTGKSLRGQATEFWLSKLTEWSKNSILDTETELLLRLQSSVDDLEEKEAVIKECFMDLGSFPEDQRIPAAALIDMWTELYKLDDDFLCIKNLLELTNRGLANLVIPRKENIETVDGYYVEYFVSQPALLRQLAIYNAKLDPIEDRKRLIVVTGHNQPKWLTEQKSQHINARLLSISSDGMFSEEWLSVHVPQVEVLVLNFKTENNALPEFVEKIDKLKVLIVTNYGSLPTGLSNFDLLGSLSNLKRIRLERISIPSITKNFVPLKSLKKISLFMCNIGQAFCNCSIKISDAWPSLEEMNIDYCHDLVSLPAELCDFVYLKKLSITNCHKLFALPDEIEKLENLEVLRLRSCTDLVSLPGSIEKLNKLYFLDIYNCISIKELPERISEMSGLTKINIGQSGILISRGSDL